MENITETISPKIISIWRFEYLKRYVSILFILCIFLFIAHYFQPYMWILLALYFITAVIFIQAIYKIIIYPPLLQQSWRYQMNKYYIHISYGVFHSQQSTVPINKIDAVYIQKTSELKGIGLVNIHLQTSKTSMYIPAISIDEVEQVQKMVNKLNNAARYDNKKEDEPLSTSMTNIYDRSWKNIPLLALTSCYIFLCLCLLFALYIKLSDIFSFESHLVTSITRSWLTFLLIVVFLIILSILVSIIYRYLTLGTYKVAVDPTYIYIRQSGFNQVNTIIPKSYIAGYIIQAPFTLMPISFVKANLILSDEAREKSGITTDFLFPFISRKQVATISEAVFPEHKWIEVKPAATLSSEAYFAELIQPSYLLVIITFFFMFFWPEYWVFPVLYALFIMFKRILKTKAQAYSLNNQLLQISKGSFSMTSTTVMLSSVERIDVEQTWLQSKLELVSIFIITKTKPIDTIKIDNVKKELAHELCHSLKKHS